jgi:TRAP-type C4-dicarboxylate transport system permease small subunit
MSASRQMAHLKGVDTAKKSPKGKPMGIAKIVGVVLVAAGTLGLIYGGFTYTKETHSAKLGPVVLQVQERETVYVPLIVSAALLALGAVLLVALKSK